MKDDKRNPMFPDMPAASEHPANIGLDFGFDSRGISESALRNYLSRAQNCNIFEEGFSHAEEDMRMIFKTGAKLVCRAATPWVMSAEECSRYGRVKELVARMHEADPELIFENCIFETVYTSVSEIPVPASAFEAFGLPAERRCFSYEDMLFPDGRFVDHWGSGASVPDISRPETQLWMYSRGCMFIDMGFECIHFGQIMLMAKSDVGFVIFDRIISMIRRYAAEHARRGWVFVNAHIYDDRVGGTDQLITDFHISPTRGLPPAGSVPHAPSEGDPQRIEIKVGQFDAIYLDSVGGLAPSGWRASSLPYLVELDNAGGYESRWLDKPSWPKQTEWYDGGWWGFDEISWFAEQPAWYRREWLRRAWLWIKHIDGFGCCQMPGHRPAALRVEGKLVSSQYLAADNGDWETMRDIWVQDRAAESGNN